MIFHEKYFPMEMLTYAPNPCALQLMLGCGIATAFLVGLITSWRVLALIGKLFDLDFDFEPCFIIPHSYFMFTDKKMFIKRQTYWALLTRIQPAYVIPPQQL